MTVYSFYFCRLTVRVDLKEMSISSSDTDSDNDIEDDIICVAISKQIRREQWLLSQRPQHTSRPGMAWVIELL